MTYRTHLAAGIASVLYLTSPSSVSGITTTVASVPAIRATAASRESWEIIVDINNGTSGQQFCGSEIIDGVLVVDKPSYVSDRQTNS